MNHLLTSDCFSSFLLESASVTTFNTFHIDGRIHPEFFNNESEEYLEKTKYNFSKFLDLGYDIYVICGDKRTKIYPGMPVETGKDFWKGMGFVLYLTQVRRA